MVLCGSEINPDVLQVFLCRTKNAILEMKLLYMVLELFYVPPKLLPVILKLLSVILKLLYVIQKSLYVPNSIQLSLKISIKCLKYKYR